MKILILYLILVLLQIPLFSQKKIYNITDFGAVGDSLTLNTQAIQKAIDRCSTEGGGRVLIPKGQFISGTIRLKTGVELHLTEGGVLLGSTDYTQYQRGEWPALILGFKQKNIAITGKGTIDGQGNILIKNILKLWVARQLPNDFPDSTLRQKERIRPKESNRPEIIELIECENIRIEGVTIKNGCSWVQTYDRCVNLNFKNIKVESTSYWNNDGIDLVDCRRVKILNCTVNSADDAICLKSHYRHLRCEDILIKNCTLRSSASALKFGTASYGGFRRIKVRNLMVYDTYRSAVALESVDGGVLEDIDIKEVKAANTGNAVFIRLGHRNKDSIYGIVRNIRLSHFNVEVPYLKPDKGYETEGPLDTIPYNLLPASITGLPNYTVKNVVLKNITITYGGKTDTTLAYRPIDSIAQVPENAHHYPEFSMFGELPAWAFYVRHTEGVVFKNFKVNVKENDYRPAFVFDDVRGIFLNKINITNDRKKPSYVLKNSRSKAFEKIGIDANSEGILFLK
jgi:polygalacturonase